MRGKAYRFPPSQKPFPFLLLDRPLVVPSQRLQRLLVARDLPVLAVIVVAAVARTGNGWVVDGRLYFGGGCFVGALARATGRGNRDAAAPPRPLNSLLENKGSPRRLRAPGTVRLLTGAFILAEVVLFEL